MSFTEMWYRSNEIMYMKQSVKYERKDNGNYCQQQYYYYGYRFPKGKKVQTLEELTAGNWAFFSLGAPSGWYICEHINQLVYELTSTFMVMIADTEFNGYLYLKIR